MSNPARHYRTTLSSYPPEPAAVFGDVEFGEINVKTVQQDYDGDTIPNDVADTFIIESAEQGTPASRSSDLSGPGTATLRCTLFSLWPTRRKARLTLTGAAWYARRWLR